MKPSPDAAELLREIEIHRQEIARLTSLSVRRAMEPEQHRIELESAREAERAAMESLAKKFAHRAASPTNGMDFCDLIRETREIAQSNPGDN